MQIHKNCSKLWVLYAAMVFGMLANTITTTSRSNLSKLMEEHEVKLFIVMVIITIDLMMIQ